MTTTVTVPETAYVTYPIVKFEETSDGHLMVYGKATDGTVDTDEQIVDPAWSAKAIESWLTTGGNVRVQHNPALYPAGRGLEVEIDRDGDSGHWVKSLIVEPTAKTLVREGVLRAYSVGIHRPVIRRDPSNKARGGIITGGEDTEIAEISLVDRPANRNCGITLVKSASLGTDDEASWTTGDLAAALALKAAKPTSKTDDEEDGEDEERTDAGATDSQDRDSDDDGAAETPETDDDDDKCGKAAWHTAHRAWLTREPRLGDVSTTGTEFLAKRAAWHTWMTEGERDGLTADGYATWAQKRDVDPNVGGGVDRDELKPSDFVFSQERAFPVVTPGDVPDAVSSWGRYRGKRTFEEFRRRLIALCRRKGTAFVSQLPKDWDVEQKSDTADDMGATPAVKGAKDCPNPDCDQTYHADSKLRTCSSCGTKLPHADEEGEKAADPDGADKAQPAGTAPASEHREPDGLAVEQLEQDAGMSTTPDPGNVNDQVPASMKSDDDVPYRVVRMHDALCPHVSWDQVQQEYPALKTVVDAVDPRWFATLTARAVVAGDLEAAKALAQVTKGADSVRTLDPALLADARAAITKGAPAVATMPPSGHAMESISPSMLRTYYTRAGRQEAEAVMRAMHDHIAAVFPHLCSACEATAAQPQPSTKAAAPVPQPPAVDGAPVTVDQVMGIVKAAVAEHIPAAAPTTPTAVPVDVEAIITAAVDRVAKAIRTEYDQTITALQAEIDELGAQPDPQQAPVRGVVRKAASQEPAQSPATTPTPQQEYIAYLQQYADPRNPNVGQREQAERVLASLLSQ